MQCLALCVQDEELKTKVEFKSDYNIETVIPKDFNTIEIGGMMRRTGQKMALGT